MLFLATWVLEELTSVFIFINVWVLCFAWIRTLAKPWWGGRGVIILISECHRGGIKLRLLWLHWHNRPGDSTYIVPAHVPQLKLYQEKKKKKKKSSSLFSPRMSMSLIKPSSVFSVPVELSSCSSKWNVQELLKICLGLGCGFHCQVFSHYFRDALLSFSNSKASYHYQVVKNNSNEFDELSYKWILRWALLLLLPYLDDLHLAVAMMVTARYDAWDI